MQLSKTVSSNQPGIHDQLDQVVTRHLQAPFRRPFPEYSLQAFDRAQQWIGDDTRPIIMDSFCGVGESTHHLAQQYPEALVIGVDKSAHRLAKHSDHYTGHKLENYCLIQADVDDFWRLAVAANWRPIRHCLFYPNPWPKKAHLKRRVHGSPVFPALLALGGIIELRSNWAVYVQEFAKALVLAGHKPSYESLPATQAVTPFERKYQAAEQELWACYCSLPSLPSS